MMSNQTLRSLARDYAIGLIPKDKYRKERSNLIKGIIAGEVSVKAINFPPPLQPAKENEAVTEKKQRHRDENKTEIISRPITPKKNVDLTQNQSVSNKSNKKSPALFISISTSLVILLITVIILFYPKPPGSTSNRITVPTTSTPTDVNKTVTNMAGENLITYFLTKKNWSEESINEFIGYWSSLTQEEKDTASQTKRMQRMHDSIYKQFLEEKALENIDREKAIIKQQKLIKFAESIGINDPRLTLDY